MKWLVMIVVSFAATARVARADEYQTALRKLAHATYKYSEMDEIASRLEREYVPKDLIRYGGYAAPLVVLIVEKRIKFKWSFP